MSVKESIQSQYHSALFMPKTAIGKCPEELWVDNDYINSYWHFDKLELQFYNIHHIHQHTGELCVRLSAQGEIDIPRVGTRKKY